jgi:cation diffusion facilitator CzcD-associated flavoprotein CzcO
MESRGRNLRVGIIGAGMAGILTAGMLREAALTVLRKGKSELTVGWSELDAALGPY